MQHPVEAALRADIQASISQDWHDLPRWLGGLFRLIAGEQDSLTFLVAQAMRHPAVAAFTAIAAVPNTGELSPPALQGGEPHAQHSRHLTGPAPAATAASRISGALRRSAAAVNLPRPLPSRPGSFLRPSAMPPPPPAPCPCGAAPAATV